MSPLLISEATGGAAILLLAVAITIPYAVRGRWLAAAGRGGGLSPRIAPHYWIGFTIAGLAFVHAGFAMAGPLALDIRSSAGIWIATGALFLALGQALLGNRLRSLRGQGRIRVRRVHFLVMGGLVVTVTVHVGLNGAVAQAVLARLGA